MWNAAKVIPSSKYITQKSIYYKNKLMKINLFLLMEEF